MTISKRLCLFFLLVIHISLSQATDIIVDFTIISENTIPDSVWVHNTTKDSAIMLHNNTSLYLSYTSANINKPLTNDKLQLYPNPAQTQATIAYTATYNGMHHINITDMSGRTITSYSTNLSIGTHQFALPALTAANYCITVSSIQYTSSTILMSTYQGQTTDNTIKLTTSEAAGNELKSTTIESTLPYDIGDKLQLTAYLNKQNATLTISPQTSTTVDFDIVILRITLEEWENSNFPIYAEITVENGKDTLNINTENLDIFLTNLKDITVEDGKEINIKFDGATVSPENLKDIFDSGIDVELVNKNGDIYTMSGTFKTYILEDLYDFEENTIYNMDNPNINTSNNFDDMVLDFSDENGIFTSPNTDYINSYANNFGKRDIVGEEFDDIYFTDIYI